MEARDREGVTDPDPSAYKSSSTKRLDQDRGDSLVAQLARLSVESGSSDTFTIPPQLLLTLSLLRSHVENLERDNEALRYTFLQPINSSDASRVSREAAQHSVDLKDILDRVKDLIRENEELGEMVIEAGRTRTADWQKALDESKAVIASLDRELEQHLGIIKQQQTELDMYRSRYGPIAPSLEYEDSNAKLTAKAELRQLRQTSSASEYFAKFRQYVAVLGWKDGNHLVEQARSGLKDEILDELARHGKEYETVVEFMTDVVSLDNCLSERRKEKAKKEELSQHSEYTLQRPSGHARRISQAERGKSESDRALSSRGRGGHGRGSVRGRGGQRGRPA